MFAEVIKRDPKKDLALLKIDEKNNVSIELPKLEPIISTAVPQIGTDVSWIGYPLLPGEERGEFYRCGFGKICSTPRQFKNLNHYFLGIEVNGEFNSGHSGGPIFDVKTGELYGIVSASAGSLSYLDLIFSDLQKMFIFASQPILASLDKPTSGLFQGHNPSGWFGLRGTGLDNYLKEVKQLLENFYNTKININQYKNPDGSISIPPHIPQLFNLAGSYHLLTNIVEGVKASYQMGIGVSVLNSELKNFLDNYLP